MRSQGHAHLLAFSLVYNYNLNPTERERSRPGAEPGPRAPHGAQIKIGPRRDTDMSIITRRSLIVSGVGFATGAFLSPARLDRIDRPAHRQRRIHLRRDRRQRHVELREASISTERRRHQRGSFDRRCGDGPGRHGVAPPQRGRHRGVYSAIAPRAVGGERQPGCAAYQRARRSAETSWATGRLSVLDRPEQEMSISMA